MKTEVLLVEKDSPVLEDEEGPENERELEALAIAGKYVPWWEQRRCWIRKQGSTGLCGMEIL
ncbi:MAG: hypothetical protein ACLU2Y_12975 [Blautia massiliensis (ex Durand et al. 2017)]|uniref:hypothetical protein n=1 Tax=Blautia massiliensis (ex Durand et al. 2017) TaxID=1737424 RepID=UPI00399CE983